MLITSRVTRTAEKLIIFGIWQPLPTQKKETCKKLKVFNFLLENKKPKKKKIQQKKNTNKN